MGQGHFTKQNIVSITNRNPSVILGTAELKITFSCLEGKRSDVTLRPALKHFVQESLSPSLCNPLDVAFLWNFVAQLPLGYAVLLRIGRCPWFPVVWLFRRFTGGSL